MKQEILKKITDAITLALTPKTENEPAEVKAADTPAAPASNDTPAAPAEPASDGSDNDPLNTVGLAAILDPANTPDGTYGVSFSIVGGVITWDELMPLDGAVDATVNAAKQALLSSQKVTLDENVALKAELKAKEAVITALSGANKATGLVQAPVSTESKAVSKYEAIFD